MAEPVTDSECAYCLGVAGTSVDAVVAEQTTRALGRCDRSLSRAPFASLICGAAEPVPHSL